jgi:hypothetical protein
MLITFVGSVHNPKIMLSMLVKVLCGDAIAARRCLPREGNITFEDLTRVASDFDIRTVTFEGLTSVRDRLPIMVGIVTVIATMRSSGLSWSHDTRCTDGGVGSLSNKSVSERFGNSVAWCRVGPATGDDRRRRPCLIGVAIPRPEPLRRRRAAFLVHVCKCRAGSPARGLKPSPTGRLRRVILHLSYSMALSHLLDTTPLRSTSSVNRRA